MPHHLNTAHPAFEHDFDAFLAVAREGEIDVREVVANVIATVASRGDKAVIDYTRTWDRVTLTSETLAVGNDEIDAAVASAPSHEVAALKRAAERIEAYHARQRPEDAMWEDTTGATLGWRWTAVESVGLYVPGGRASYPSSVLMNAIPARVAGVSRVVMCAPTPDGAINPLVLCAARLSGIDTVYRIGGAQAVAALAYGTETIAPVAKITGPGNAYVAEAKRQVFGRVGIDMIAGPSEVLIIADADNDPDWIALDLMSQAEHDPEAQSILITDDAGFADSVVAAVEARLSMLERRQIAGESWSRHGAVILVRSLDEAPALVDRIAPEHLQICMAEADVMSARIRNAGAIFLGHWTPEAIGDYVGGPNHVLPTARSARFSSGLSVLDFMKRTTIARMTPGSIGQIGDAGVTLANAEGLEAHGLSVSVRLDRLNRS